MPVVCTAVVSYDRIKNDLLAFVCVFGSNMLRRTVLSVEDDIDIACESSDAQIAKKIKAKTTSAAGRLYVEIISQKQ